MGTVTVRPAPPNSGRYFTCHGDRIPANLAAVGATAMSTELQAGETVVRTVEHLLAALMASGIDNAEIALDGTEIPILDGSALPWVQAIAEAGIVTQDAPRPSPILDRPVTVWEGDGFVSAIPAPQLRFTYGIEFPTAAIGLQWVTWSPAAGDFAAEIAPARTFALAEWVEGLRARGLIAGASLENAIVCDGRGWLNPPLRFDDEPCRHKLLDSIGDLSLLGVIPQAHIVAFKAGHALHVRFARAVAQLCDLSMPAAAL